ncbi:C-terminal binding protein [soil metagenome]
MPQALITDFAFPDLTFEQEVCDAAGVSLSSAQCRTSQDIAAIAGDADAVIVQFAKAGAEAIAAMKNARVIVRYGIGVDNVDLAAAAARGIPVCNVPDYCLEEVADHTLAFILSLTRQIIPNARVVSEGGWKLASPVASMMCLRDLTVGVAGFGRIGREVVRRLVPFGCRILVFDPVAPAAAIAELGAAPATWDELVEQSDLLTLHCPSTPATRGMINAEMLARTKKGCLLVNASRGDLIVTSDVIDALRAGILGGAAFDVTNPEPPAPDDPLRTMPNVIIHSHIASVSPVAVRRLRQTAAELAVAGILGRPLKNIVNGVTA